MSFIGDFIRSLIPGFKRDNILKDLESYRKELTEHTLPSLNSGAEFFSNYKFKNPENQGFELAFKHAVKGYPNWVKGSASIADKLEDIIGGIESLVKDNFAGDIIRDGITYRKANIIALVESIALFLRYSRIRLHYTYILESRVNGANIGGMSKATIDFLAKNQAAFLTAAAALALGKTEIYKRLKGAADVVYDDETSSAVMVTAGNSSIDPFNFFIVGTKYNLVYHARIWIADMQVERLKAAKEEQRALNYRLLNLKEMLEGRHDPKLQLEIEEVEGLLVRLNASIAKREEAYAG